MKNIKVLYHLRYSSDKQTATVNCRITLSGERATLGKFPLSSQNQENEGKFYRHKTSTEFFVPLHSKAMRLIEKYGGCNNLKFPVRSNQEMNRIIKDCADKVGIEKHLWYHTARKTFIDKYINEYALDRSVIILASGHKNESELNRYAKTNKKTVIKAFESIF